MNLPNILTLSRFLISTIVFVLIKFGDSMGLSAAFILFVVACITDYYDGEIARKRNQITVFGRIADPFADKFLVIGCFIFLYERNIGDIYHCWLNATALFLIISREFLVSSIRGYFESQGVSFPAEWLGKFKATWQYVSIGILILYFAHGGRWEGEQFVPLHWILQWVGITAVWSSVLVTLWSMQPYLKNARLKTYK
ncbi:MAG: CDP-diacylglycerol--glycerol-3-phosphate 3-phosphatidyltransferase [Planctomycetota bacterium]